MSSNYQPEKLTKFKDIETVDSQKKSILQKIWPLNRTTSIESISSNLDACNIDSSARSQQQLPNEPGTPTKKVFHSPSKERFDEEFLISRGDQSNSSDQFESNSFNTKIDSDAENADQISIRLSAAETASRGLPSISDNRYNISNVLNRVYTLMQRNSAPESSREFWMPDDQVNECFECNDKFTLIKRRHHCRVCGQIFCSKCSDHEIPAQLLKPNTPGNIRACTFCHSLVDQLETGDFMHNKNSIKELMMRLQTSPSADIKENILNNMNRSPSKNEADPSDLKLGQNEMSKASSMSISSQQSAANSNSGNNNSSNNSNNKVSIINNPFDITERDYFKSQEDEKELTKLILNNTSELRNLWISLYHTSDGLQFQTRYLNKFKKIPNCITNTELIEWLMKKNSVSRDQAIVIGQALVQGKWLQSATSSNSDHIFSEEFGYYKPGIAALSGNKVDSNSKKNNQFDAEEGPEWVSELNKIVASLDDEKKLIQQSSLQNPLASQQQDQPQNLVSQLSAQKILNKSNPIALSPLSLLSLQQQQKEKSPKMSYEDELRNKTPPMVSAASLSCSPITTPLFMPSAVSSSTTIANKPEERKSNTDIGHETEYEMKIQNFNPNEDFQMMHKKLQLNLLQQLLKLHEMSFEWFDIILDLAWKAVDLVKPDVKHDSDHMDIRNYLKFKKLPGGDKKNCRIVNGLVFTKNVAHKSMNMEMKNPKILLLRSSIEYQRVEEKLCSLEPLFTAESLYLKHNCSKLLRLNPDILIVEKSVARIAQEFLLQSGVTLVLNVKNRIMEKLCRFLQSDCIHTIDDVMRKPRLGFCSRFHVEKYPLSEDGNTVKPLMYFEGTPTNLGCTILLTGASTEELAIIKALTNFMIYVAYNSKLEQSFLIDICAFFTSKNEPKETFSNPSQAQFTLEDPSNEVKTVDSMLRKIINSVKENATKGSEERLIDCMFKMNEENENFEEIHDLFDKSNLQNDEIKSVQFQYLLDKLILSCSPFVKYKIPYLLSETGYKHCSLKKYVPPGYINFYNSNILSSLNLNQRVNIKLKKKKKPQTSEVPNFDSNDWPYKCEKKVKDVHEFLKIHLIQSVNDPDVKKIYADYRSRGHRVEIAQVLKKVNNNNEKTGEEDKSKTSETPEPIDCLDVTNRQHIAVLFYSKCETSPVYPHICISKRVIDMSFYSDSDMTLGSFLARNCFRQSYVCTNELCGTLILNHTRYFVHSEYQIVIKMNLVPDELPMATLPQLNLNPQSNHLSSNDIKYDDLNIYMWTTCKRCQKAAKKSIMSPDTWSYSLGKFLELIFYAREYNRDTKSAKDDHCRHSLFHQHEMHFRFKNMLTTFSCSSIKIRRVDLPPIALKLKPYQKDRNEYIDEIKDLSEKGLTLYSTLTDRLNSLRSFNLHEKQNQKLDQYINQIGADGNLKHKIETINLMLTKSTNLNPISFDEDNSQEFIDYHQIELLLIELKRYIGYNVNYWNNKMSDFLKRTKYDDDSEAGASELNASVETPKLIKKAEPTLQKDDECTLASNTGIVKFKKQNEGSSVDGNDTKQNDQIVSAKSVSPVDNDEDYLKQPTISVKRIFANFLPSSSFQPLKQPFADEDHFILNCDSNYYINEKDLSSIVAFTLSSKDYKDFQLSANKKSNGGSTPHGNIGSAQNNQSTKDFLSMANSLQEFDDIDTNNPNAQNIKQQFTSELHFDYQFQDSSTKFYCKVYYADLFYQLRQLIFPKQEEKYIHSLFRCMNWEAKGGKSNSQFRKTLDNRFVLKEMSKQEIQSFLEFAPKYVQYMSSCIQNNKPTSLTKIVGAYRIYLLKNASLGASKAVKIDVLVLENLFYSKKYTQVFDLKGSERNRLINTQGKQEEKELVLLDENFLRWSFDNPIHIKCHSKHVIMKAIEADTEFLSRYFVMDYSLLCGFDHVNNQIVVGIIDYIRTFTWDKKLETYFKTIGGQGRLPTIVSPEIYRTRFISAIERYFLEVPDHWYQASPEGLKH